MHWRTSCFFIPVNFYSLSGHCLPISVHFISHLFLCSTFPKHMLNCSFWVYLSSAKWLAQICHWIITETSSGFQPRYTHSLLFYWPQCHILYLFLQMWSWKATGYHMLWQQQVASSIINFQIQICHILFTIQYQ